MRIISGNFKGKKLFLPKDKHTRPLKDNVKESIFNLIQHSKKININIENSFCTICNLEYSSFRRENEQAMRQITLVALR